MAEVSNHTYQHAVDCWCRRPAWDIVEEYKVIGLRLDRLANDVRDLTARIEAAS